MEKIGDSSTGVSHLVTVYCSKQLLTPIEKAEFVWKKFVEGRKEGEERLFQCASKMKGNDVRIFEMIREENEIVKILKLSRSYFSFNLALSFRS